MGGTRMEIVVIGGGAAGLAAAIAAAEQGQQVLVLERNRKPLKKLGVTGNGRANVLNAGAAQYYGDAAFAHATLAQVGYPALCNFFDTLGVPLREEAEGRIYPAALQAVVVVDALLLRAHQLGVRFALSTRVTRLQHKGERFRLDAVQTPPQQDTSKGNRKPQPTEEIPQTLYADRVIVTVGGAAAPAHGTDGAGYALLTSLGHKVTALTPALCALTTDTRRIAGLTGQRVRAGLRLCAADGQLLHQTQGEVLFGEDAVSGIAAMQLARFVQPGCTVTLDMREGLGLSPANNPTGALDRECIARQLDTRLTARHDSRVTDWLTGLCAAPIAQFLLREAGFTNLHAPLAHVGEGAAMRLAATMEAVTLPVTGTRGFAQAQVTAGGIQTCDFDPQTMQSSLCKGLFAAGEVLDVDGECGGFNLMFAFASGLIAGRAAAR